jgi:hypothetical protein
MKFTETELSYIINEILSLEKARQEQYPADTKKEWINSFWEEGYSAEHVCRMIRKVKTSCLSYKLRYADFTTQAEEIENMTQIIPIKQLSEPVPETEPTPTKFEDTLFYRVRHNLGISFYAFTCESIEKGHKSSEEYYEYLIKNPNNTKCKKITCNETNKSIRGRQITKLSDIIKNDF